TTCHTVMKPEFTAYQNSPHARVTCTQCHIGSGADWFVRSKLSGSYQVYAALAKKYPRPIPTPIKNLRPAQETCEQCHWPKKFFGAVERVNHHYLSDEQNSQWTIRLLMRIGGGNPTQGPTGGIHWHMNVANKIEYVHTDFERQNIPWIRLTNPQGKVTTYQSTESPISEADLAKAQKRTMDCLDCHNRPSHIFYPPARSVNIAMSTGRLDPSLPFIKLNAVDVLATEYKSSSEGIKKIEASLLEKYKDYPDKNKVNHAIKEVQRIYSQNFFPEMKADWRTYPNHVGHTMYAGCYRCHDGKHQSSDGKVITHNCNACHTIIAQGSGEAAQTISPGGLEFQHPVDIGDVWKEMNCAECHTGGPM
ncbi:MAG TPA: cytochrome c3 family protein, partial [Acidobacteriota bacterium]|nr:cytochrome c3 family protein [Acidobacteriota bacterium]